jgi:hypothetical protein
VRPRQKKAAAGSGGRWQEGHQSFYYDRKRDMEGGTDRGTERDIEARRSRARVDVASQYKIQRDVERKRWAKNSHSALAAPRTLTKYKGPYR